MANRTTTGQCKNMSSFGERLRSPVWSLCMLIFMGFVLWAFTNSQFDLSPVLMINATIPLTSATPASLTSTTTTTASLPGRCHDPPEETFYDDPNLSYSIETRITGWDSKRAEWLKHHPSFADGVDERILILTGSQPSNCHNPTGDFLLLRLFKNKVDYCRIHGYDIFYNNVNLHPKMESYWAKVSIIKAAMVAHPETEWVWWVDSDAVFTDMEFKLPLKKYKNHNLVVDGWPDMIYKERSWIGLNAGVLLFRNSQWSMDFLDVWASMGPQSPYHEKWDQIVKSVLIDKSSATLDDQSALVYMLLEQKAKWGEKTYIENEYCFQAYWAAVVSEFDNVTEKYVDMEKKVPKLRRRHAEVVSERYDVLREGYLKEAGYGKGTGRRPFITHFTGCQPCSGDHNPMYKGNSCAEGIESALNFADNQVLRNFGFGRSNLRNFKSVSILPFDSPGV